MLYNYTVKTVHNSRELILILQKLTSNIGPIGKETIKSHVLQL